MSNEIKTPIYLTKPELDDINYAINTLIEDSEVLLYLNAVEPTDLNRRNAAEKIAALKVLSMKLTDSLLSISESHKTTNLGRAIEVKPTNDTLNYAEGFKQ